MGRKYRHLFERIIDPNNLKRAYGNAARGKTNSHGYLVFREHFEARIATLHAQLADGTWQSQPYRNFTVYEPKQRSISAPTFSDRVVHHAVVQVIEPIFDATFLPYSFACRNGKGTHAGVKWVQSRLRSGTYTQYLKTDFKSFFPSVDRVVLHGQFARKISCAPTLDLLARIIPATGQGIPIGALTSQLSANIYANPLDHYLHHELKVPFARYMDDVVVLGHGGGQENPEPRRAPEGSQGRDRGVCPRPAPPGDLPLEHLLHCPRHQLPRLPHLVHPQTAPQVLRHPSQTQDPRLHRGRGHRGPAGFHRVLARPRRLGRHPQSPRLARAALHAVRSTSPAPAPHTPGPATRSPRRNQ